MVTYQMEKSFYITEETSKWIIAKLLFLVYFEQMQYPLRTELSYIQMLVHDMLYTVCWDL